MVNIQHRMKRHVNFTPEEGLCLTLETKNQTSQGFTTNAKLSDCDFNSNFTATYITLHQKKPCLLVSSGVQTTFGFEKRLAITK